MTTKTTNKLTPAELANSLVAACRQLGWTISRVDDSVITLTKKFTPGSHEEFMFADMEYGGLMDLIPFKGGSVWGTDGGGIGAISAIQHGVFRINKSGNGGKRFAAALRKVVR